MSKASKPKKELLPFVRGNYDATISKPRVELGSTARIIEPPNLLSAQLDSFEWFKTEGIKQLFSLINPISDPTGNLWEVEFTDFRFGEYNRTPEEATIRDLSFDAPLYTTVKLTNKKTGVVREKEVFFMDFPMMTENGSFVHNGVSRCVVHQLIRAEGVTFLESKLVSSYGKPLYMAKLRPQRGSWIEFVINRQGTIYLKMIQGSVRIPITMLFKALGMGTNSELLNTFADVNKGETDYIQSCLKFDATQNQDDAAVAIYKMIRSDENVSAQTATRYVRNMFFDHRKLYLGRVGRYQMSKKFGYKMIDDLKEFRLKVTDFVDITKYLIEVNNGTKPADDVDSLSNRRVRSVGEQLVTQLEGSILRMEKNIKDRLSLYGEGSKIAPKMVINAKPVKSAVDMFLGMSSLSRFLDQENILAELENKRRITAGGPGGVSSDRATFSIRDIHYSQYGRLCPVKTPEKGNIGVVVHLSLYARINEFGFIEVVYRRVKNELMVGTDKLENRILSKDAKNAKDKIIAKAGTVITAKVEKTLIKDLKGTKVKVVPFISDELEWLDPYEDLEYTVTVSTVKKDEYGNILDKFVPARDKGQFTKLSVNEVDFVDVTPSQLGSVSLALVPFAGNTYDARLLYSCNMMTQAAPLATTEAPIVGTGFEEFTARQTGWGVYSPFDGKVSYVDANTVTVKGKSGQKTYDLVKYRQSNQNMSFSQKPIVSAGEVVKKGQVLVDGPSMFHGELALGKNILAAYTLIDGFNFEDGYILSERLIKEDVLTSVHVQTHTVDIRDTKLGPEIITRDIPGIPERSLKNLDPEGIVRIGASVSSGDVLVGVVAPKGERELSAEERLLRAIFGEPSREIADNSLRVPHGEEGVVIKVHVMSNEKGDKLNSGVLKQVKVWLASTKKISFGDKLAGRYGNKGTVTRVLPVEDMPHLADGTPVDIVMNPLIIKRMNMGQVYEVFYSNIAYSKGCNVAIPILEKYKKEWFDKAIDELNLPETNRVDLYDGRTGEKLDGKVAVGYSYFLRLKHIASEKLHARSTGPYTMVTQQPLAGRSHRGGQRFGEMEVWALEAYGASHVLQEMLTIKSDDVDGRSAAYKSILNGDPVEMMKTPASFKVLVSELSALGFKTELIRSEPNISAVAKEPAETPEADTKVVEKKDNVSAEKVSKKAKK